MDLKKKEQCRALVYGYLFQLMVSVKSAAPILCTSKSINLLIKENVRLK